MKYVSILLSTCLFPAFALASNQQLYQISVEVTDLIYSQTQEITPENQARIIEHFESIKNLVTGQSSIQCGSRQEVYKLAFQWARSTEGLNTHRTEAMEFASSISEKNCPLLYLNSYRTSFEWARSTTGLNTYKSKAMEFALLVSEFNAKNQFEEDVLGCIKPEFDFARSTDGLNLPRQQAEDFAKQQCGLSS